MLRTWRSLVVPPSLLALGIAAATAGSTPMPRGIQLFQQSVAAGRTEVADFESASCRVEPSVVGPGQRFVATSSDNGYKLQIYVDPFSGFGRYPVRYESSNAYFLVRGHGGPFSSIYLPAARPPHRPGTIELAAAGGRLALHFDDAFNYRRSDDVALAGAMSCQYAPPLG